MRTVTNPLSRTKQSTLATVRSTTIRLSAYIIAALLTTSCQPTVTTNAPTTSTPFAPKADTPTNLTSTNSTNADSTKSSQPVDSHRIDIETHSEISEIDYSDAHNQYDPASAPIDEIDYSDAYNQHDDYLQTDIHSNSTDEIDYSDAYNPYAQDQEIITTHALLPFSADLLTTLREENSFCQGFAQCHNAAYSFSDILLVSKDHHYGSYSILIVPYQPISREKALNYARILDTESHIDFNNNRVSLEFNSETFYTTGLKLPSEGGEQPHSVTKVDFHFVPNTDKVKEITFGTFVL